MSERTSGGIPYWQEKLDKLFATCPQNDFFEAIWGWNSIVAGRNEAGLAAVNFDGDMDDFKKHERLWFPQWEIESLINRYLAYLVVRKSDSRVLNIKGWSGFSTLLNCLKGLENAESMVDVNKEDFLASIQRLFLPQYFWQVGFDNRQKLCRSWTVYGGPKCQAAFAQKYGVDFLSFFELLSGFSRRQTVGWSFAKTHF